MTFLDKLGGRKFVLTLLFAVIVIANAWLKIGLQWQELLALAGMFGIYDVANALKAQAFPVNTQVVKYVEDAGGPEPGNPDE